MIGAKTTLLAMCAVAAFVSGPASAATARRESFGTLKDGTPIEAVTLVGSNGVSARIISFGATLQALKAPDRQGRVSDVELGSDDLSGYVDHPSYFGSTIGRYANRIAGG